MAFALAAWCFIALAVFALQRNCVGQGMGLAFVFVCSLLFFRRYVDVVGHGCDLVCAKMEIPVVMVCK